MSKLLDLMKQLGSDAALASDYAKDPAAVIARAGLSKEESAALIAVDDAAIKRLTGLKEVSYATNTVVKAYD
jgi:hypothetical protein